MRVLAFSLMLAVFAQPTLGEEGCKVITDPDGGEIIGNRYRSWFQSEECKLVPCQFSGSVIMAPAFNHGGYRYPKLPVRPPFNGLEYNDRGIFVRIDFDSKTYTHYEYSTTPNDGSVHFLPNRHYFYGFQECRGDEAAGSCGYVNYFRDPNRPREYVIIDNYRNKHHRGVLSKSTYVKHQPAVERFSKEKGILVRNRFVENTPSGTKINHLDQFLIDPINLRLKAHSTFMLAGTWMGLNGEVVNDEKNCKGDLEEGTCEVLDQKKVKRLEIGWKRKGNGQASYDVTYEWLCPNPHKKQTTGTIQ